MFFGGLSIKLNSFSLFVLSGQIKKKQKNKKNTPLSKSAPVLRALQVCCFLFVFFFSPFLSLIFVFLVIFGCMHACILSLIDSEWKMMRSKGLRFTPKTLSHVGSLSGVWGWFYNLLSSSMVEGIACHF